ALGCVLMAVVLLLNAGVSWLRRWRQRVDGLKSPSWGATFG
ncbi:MAG: ABC transporter permease, partial [Betaproteobacteria bacterium]|nr:ABC transporter permease [Betaproteobacteria bacterium]